MSFGRRDWMKGVAAGTAIATGGALLSPLLTSLRAENSSGGGRRFVIVVEGNGIEPINFISAPTRDALVRAGADVAGVRHPNRLYAHENALEVESAQLSTAPALGALAAAGEPSLEQHAAVLLGLSSKISGGGHSSDFGALSCAQSTETVPSAATIDHVLGQIKGVGDLTPFDVVRLGIHAKTGRTNYSTCASAARRPAPIVCDATAAFNALFGSVADSAGQQVFRDRRDLLDFARADVTAALAEFGGSSRERQKLEHYLESIETLTARHQRIGEMQPQLEQAAPPGPGTSPLYDSMHPLEHLDAMFELAGAALIGCLTNIVVIASGTGQQAFDVYYTSIDASTSGRHAVCHADDAAFIATVTEKHASLTARLARTLMAVPEGDGTMLDHTTIIYMSDNGEKHHAHGEEWPILLLGGSALGLRTDGRTIAYPKFGDDNHRQLSNVFNTLHYLAGAPTDTFGAEGDTRIAEGPLDQLM